MKIRRAESLRTEQAVLLAQNEKKRMCAMDISLANSNHLTRCLADLSESVQSATIWPLVRVFMFVDSRSALL